jgi:TPR repeat protein
MLKGYTSFFALMSVVGSLSEPAWCMEKKEQNELVSSSAIKKRKSKTDKTDPHSNKKRKREEGNINSQISNGVFPTLKGITPELRAIIYSYLFSGNPSEIVKNAANLEMTSKVFFSEVEAEIGDRTLVLRKSIKDENIEEWEASPLRAFWQAHKILDTLAKGSAVRHAGRVYFDALQDGSFVSESRLLAYNFALIGALRYEDVNPPKLAKEKIIATLHSLWRDLQQDKARRRPFDSQKYEALLRIYFFLRNNPELCKTFFCVDPLGDELKTISKLGLNELSNFPTRQLNVIAMRDNHFHGRLWLSSAKRKDKIGQFSLACLYLQDRIEESLFQEDEAGILSSLIGEQNETPLKKIENCDSPKTTNQDYQLAAAFWMQEAANQNLLEAQNNYAILQLQGIGVPQDQAAAYIEFKQAAEGGLAFGQYNLAVCYADGIGTEQNDALALEWFKKAAEQKMTRAQFTVGLYYDLGKGCVQDYDQAAMWYRRAHEDRDPFNYDSSTIDQECDCAAENNLGLCYELGRGVDQDNETAFELYRWAEGQESIEAYINVAHCHELGKGTPQDLEQAERSYGEALEASELKTKMGLLANYGNPPIQMGLTNWLFMSYPDYK